MSEKIFEEKCKIISDWFDNPNIQNLMLPLKGKFPAPTQEKEVRK